MEQLNPYEAPKSDPTLPDTAGPYEKPPLKTLLFSFGGRIPRRIFWGGSLAIAAVFYAAIFAIVLVFGEDSPVFPISVLILYIPMIWISLALQIKRWHDRDKSGWWIFIGVIPILGAIWAFIETGCLRGTFGPNRYGPDPT